MEPFYAHSGKSTNDFSDWQPLKEHLLNVAELAKQFALEARPGDEEFVATAYLAGLLHDLGKYRQEFQDMIRGRRCKGESTRHKHIGAAYAGQQKRFDLAFAIQGHHGGMPNKVELSSAVADGATVLTTLWRAAEADCPALPRRLGEWGSGVDAIDAEMRTRLLFSCLVDADWLDTSEHYARCRGLPTPPQAPELRADDLLCRVRAYIAAKAAACRDAKMAFIRDEVLCACLTAAEMAPGLFAMTVPTGGGKTLSSLAFALAHAHRFRLRRIIYVSPYLSIIEQNARVFREALGDESNELILEHHSMAEPRTHDSAHEDQPQSDEAQRLAENWDVPVVLTTSVQFYESLLSNGPGRCRKLHNVARGVVILDECQTLPKGLTAPTCRMLQQISEYLGCSIVLCTATQPAWEKSSRLAEGLENVRPIVPESLDLFQRLNRVRVCWPKLESPPLDWPAVAQLMLAHSQALCVVNTKKAARELFEELRRMGASGLFHLSTAMCPAHRLQILDQVRALLAGGKPCYLVSTQLVEAGVDVDFPLLLREMAPLESIVQAAGRCNREGLLNNSDGRPGGEAIVFRSVEAKMPMDGWYRNGTAVVQQDFLACMREPNIHSPADLAEYFRRLYPTGDLDQNDIVKLRRTLAFKDVSMQYKLIDSATTALVVTAWTAGHEEVERLLEDMRGRPSRRSYRRLQRFSVNVYPQDLKQLGGSVVLDYVPGINLCGLPYDENLGLVPTAGGALVF